VQTDADGKVVEFVGPRDPNRVYQNQCNAAVYAMSKQIFDYIDHTEFTDRSQDFSNDVFPLIIEQNEHLHTYSLERGGYIKDMGTPSRLAEVEKYLENKAK
jgi:NDP-sugar pyrophosphorylase family protein